MEESPRVWFAWLKDENREVRHRAVLALGGPKSARKEFVPELIEALKSDDADFRFWAAVALAGIRHEARDAVPELIELLQDNLQRNRQTAALALGRIGPAADPAVPALVRTLKNDLEKFVRHDVVKALGDIGTPEAIKALIEALSDRESVVRDQAAIQLRVLGPKAREAVPALRHLMVIETEKGVRIQVEAALLAMNAN